MRNNSKVVFIVVTFNSEKYLDLCLSSLVNLKSSFEKKIVVVDNNSSDRSIEIVRNRPEISLICLKENLGFGKANNIAVRNFNGDFYFLINPDAWIDKNFDLDRVIGSLREHERVAICGARLKYPDGSSQTAFFTFSSPLKWLIQAMPGYFVVSLFLRRYSRALSFGAHIGSLFNSYCNNHRDYVLDYSLEEVDWVSGAAMIISNSYIKTHDLFDENIFLYGEDEDLCIQAKKNGWRVCIMNTPQIFHVHGWNSRRKKNLILSHIKYISLSYFINKNISSSMSRAIMYFLLPKYVYGWKGWFIRGKNAFRNSP